MSEKVCYRCRQEMNIIKLVKVYEYFMLKATASYMVNKDDFEDAMIGLTDGVNLFSHRIGIDYVFPKLPTGKGLEKEEFKQIYLKCLTMNCLDPKDANVLLFKDFLNTYRPIINKASNEKLQYEKLLRESLAKNTSKSVVKEIATISASVESSYQVNSFHLPQYCATVPSVKTPKTSVKTKTKDRGKDK